MSMNVDEMGPNEKATYFANLWNEQKSEIWRLEGEIEKRDQVLRNIRKEIDAAPRSQQPYVSGSAIKFHMIGYGE